MPYSDPNCHRRLHVGLLPKPKLRTRSHLQPTPLGVDQRQMKTEH